MSEGITVALVDDHEIVRQGVRALLETQRDITIVGEAILGFTRNPARFASENHGNNRQERKADHHDGRQFEGGHCDERDASNEQRGLPDKLREDAD